MPLSAICVRLSRMTGRTLALTRPSSASARGAQGGRAGTGDAPADAFGALVREADAPPRYEGRSGGKAEAIQSIKASRGYKSLVMVGDGATDLEARRPGGADLFIG